MPVTPFHMGPGILIKAVLQGYFSLIVFGWAQILMDLQPLFVILTGIGHLHGFSHTYIGATLIAIVSALTGRWLSELVLKFLRRDFTEYQRVFFDISRKVTVVTSFVSAFIGTFSHVLLDGIMHADVEPYYPVTAANNSYLLVSIETLYKLCIYTGIIGAIIYLSIRLIFKLSDSKQDKVLK